MSGHTFDRLGQFKRSTGRVEGERVKGMTDLIQEVKAALQAVTPGPWRTHQDGITAEDTTIAWEVSDEQNMHLIANSPTWLQQLVERLETAEKQREEAVKALEWYGDMDNYHPEVYECSFAENENGYYECSKMDTDIGELARTTLKRIKGESQAEGHQSTESAQAKPGAEREV